MIFIFCSFSLFTISIFSVQAIFFNAIAEIWEELLQQHPEKAAEIRRLPIFVSSTGHPALQSAQKQQASDLCFMIIHHPSVFPPQKLLSCPLIREYLQRSVPEAFFSNPSSLHDTSSAEMDFFRRQLTQELQQLSQDTEDLSQLHQLLMERRERFRRRCVAVRETALSRPQRSEGTCLGSEPDSCVLDLSYIAFLSCSLLAEVTKFLQSTSSPAAGKETEEGKVRMETETGEDIPKLSFPPDERSRYQPSVSACMEEFQSFAGSVIDKLDRLLTLSTCEF